jgi:threonine/homoserine/homoserine lactone efflux protein
MLAEVLAFAGVAAVANLTPGLDMMLVLRTSVSGGRSAGLAADAGERSAVVEQPRGKLAAFRAGFGTNLLNPKAGVFYMSLLPQFVPHGAPVFGTTLLLTVIDIAELTVLYLVVSAAAAALAHRISRASFKRRMEQVSGVVFLGFAASLVFDRS